MLTKMHIPADPIPTLTQRLREAGASESAPTVEQPLAVDGKPMSPTMSEAGFSDMRLMLRLASGVVSALSNDERPFSVRLSKGERTASTDLASREVVIGIAPLVDPTLTLGQRVAMAVAMAYHEVGHVIYSRHNDMTKGYEPKHHALVHYLYNIAQDVHLEAQQARTFPGYAATLLVKQWFYGTDTTLDLTSLQTRTNSLIVVALYPNGVGPVLPEHVEWFERATEWTKKCAHPGANSKMRALLREAFDLVTTGLETESEEDDESGKGESGKSEGEQPSDSKPGDEGKSSDEQDDNTGGTPDPTPGETDKPDSEQDGDSRPGPDEMPQEEDDTETPTEDGGDGDQSGAPFTPEMNDTHTNSNRTYTFDHEQLAKWVQSNIDRLDTGQRLDRNRVLVTSSDIAGQKVHNREVRIIRRKATLR